MSYVLSLLALNYINAKVLLLVHTSLHNWEQPVPVLCTYI